MNRPQFGIFERRATRGGLIAAFVAILGLAMGIALLSLGTGQWQDYGEALVIASGLLALGRLAHLLITRCIGNERFHAYGVYGDAMSADCSAFRVKVSRSRSGASARRISRVNPHRSPDRSKPMGALRQLLVTLADYSSEDPRLCIVAVHYSLEDWQWHTTRIRRANEAWLVHESGALRLPQGPLEESQLDSFFDALAQLTLTAGLMVGSTKVALLLPKVGVSAWGLARGLFRSLLRGVPGSEDERRSKVLVESAALSSSPHLQMLEGMADRHGWQVIRAL